MTEACLYDLHIRHFQNSGLGWERIEAVNGGTDSYFGISLGEAERLAAERDRTSTEAKLRLSNDPEFVVAMAGLKSSKLQWIDPRDAPKQ